MDIPSQCALFVTVSNQLLLLVSCDCHMPSIIRHLVHKHCSIFLPYILYIQILKHR
ncbi:hypothetical protein SCLCIDRAFT_498705 [Scleroderma citrinum Foug A]|uniref:Uncharacterized protein n=1 Tax=Scleroderma citrinum Foug A TaxID=1036808 RepID=A0A0C3EPB6_9AGAM|nr:hypothetical protein SCLCIDRAFT_498705 [Scleroderma citrinum Foug A]